MKELAQLLGRPVAAISQKLLGILSAESLHDLNNILDKETRAVNLVEDENIAYQHSDGVDEDGSLCRSNESIVR